MERESKVKFAEKLSFDVRRQVVTPTFMSGSFEMEYEFKRYFRAIRERLVISSLQVTVLVVVVPRAPNVHFSRMFAHDVTSLHPTRECHRTNLQNSQTYEVNRM